MAFTYKHGDTPLEGYVIQRGVGRGGFGEVYYALSEGGKEVALKYLRENPQIELRGTQHCMNLKSPHLVTIYDVKQNAEGEYFIVMEYVHGPSLRDLLVAEPNGLGMQKAAFFVSEIAKGLRYLHDRGIIHRDMKPGNIFYEDGYVKIGDYGLSKFISLSRHSGQTASIGTVHYMAPEVGSGNYHRGIDIYALGVMLYEMLLGRVPFEGSSMGEVLMKHLTEQPEVDALPAPFAEVIRKALAKDPTDRYQTVDEMAQDILGAEEVRKSIANFKPGSLTSIARQAMETQVMDTPHPSPHGAAGAGLGVAGAAKARPRRRDDDVLDAQQFSNRLAERMERVGERKGYGPPTPAAGPQAADVWTPPGQAPGPAPRGSRFQGLLISTVVALGLSVGIALLAGSRRTLPEHTMLCFGFIIALRLGVAIAERIIRRVTAPPRGSWGTRLITLGCCALPVLVVGAIADEELGRLWKRVWGVEPFMLMLAVLACSGAVDWIKRVGHGMQGRVEFGDAFKAGLFGLIVGAIFGEGESPVMVMSAGIAAAASLSIQASALFRRPVGVGQVAGPGPPPTGPAPGAAKRNGRDAGPAVMIGAAAICGDDPCCPDDSPSDPLGGYQSPLKARATFGYDALRRPPRSGPSRLFWGVVSGLLLFGACACGLGAGMVAHGDEEMMGFLIEAACCAIMSVFTLLKTTAYRRAGFWNETARPFLACAFFSGAAALGFALGFLSWIPDDEFAAVCGLVVCGVFGLLCTFIGGRHDRTAGGTGSRDHRGLRHAQGGTEEDELSEDSYPAIRTGLERRRRSAFLRYFWMAVSAMLLCGAGICGLGGGLIAHDDEELMGFIMGAACCGIMFIFTALKSTSYKRLGFWNETGRPLLACTFLCGVVAQALVIGFMNLDDAGLFGVISGMIPCGVLALLFMFVGGQKHSGIRPTGGRHGRQRTVLISAIFAAAFVMALVGAALVTRLVGARHPVAVHMIEPGDAAISLSGAEPGQDYHRVIGAEDLFYRWHLTQDRRHIKMVFLSDALLYDVPLRYTLRDGRGTTVVEDVRINLRPGENPAHDFHLGTKVRGGEVRVELIGPPGG